MSYTTTTHPIASLKRIVTALMVGGMIFLIVGLFPDLARADLGFLPCDGSPSNPCGTCEVVSLANTIITWLIGFTFMLFAVLFAIAGFKLVTSGGNQSALQAAKDSLVNALIGLLIILAAWLLVDTLLKAILDGNGDGTADGQIGTMSGIGPWAQIECYYQVKSNEFHGDYVDPSETATSTSPSATTTSTYTGSGPNCPSLSEANVVAIPGSGYMATPETVANFMKMKEAAALDGITLTVISGWRSDQSQVELYNKYCPGGTCGATKVAKPCSLGGNGSNHNSGTAIDISVGCKNGQSNCNTPTYNWLKANGKKYGFNNNLPTDPVHWSPSGR